MSNLTDIQQKIFGVLSDGRIHAPEEMRGCLWDELAGIEQIRNHISQMRLSIRPKGYDVVYVARGPEQGYQLVRLLASAYDGVK